jgi:hypothetical protein
MLTRSTGVANTCRNLMVTLNRVDWSASRERERERAQNPKHPSFSRVISSYYSSATTEEEKKICQIIVCLKSLRGSPRIRSRESAIIDLTTISRRGETSRFSRSEFFFFFFCLGVVGDRGRGRLEQIQKCCLWRVIHEVRGEERRGESNSPCKASRLDSFSQLFFVSVSICHDFHERLLLVTQTSEVSSFRCKAQRLWVSFFFGIFGCLFSGVCSFFDGDGWFLDWSSKDAAKFLPIL